MPLWRSIADYYGAKGDATISVYASCGHFRDDDALADEVRKAIDLGYRTVKIKALGNEDDSRRIERAAGLRPAGRGPEWGASRRGLAASRRPVSPLAWIEGPRRRSTYERLQPRGGRERRADRDWREPVFASTTHATCCATAGCGAERDFIQVDPLLAYRLSTSTSVSSSCTHMAAPAVPAACRPSLRRALRRGLRPAAWPRRRPMASLAYGGYWDGMRVDGGRVKIPDVPGAGFEAKANLFAILKKT